MNTPLRALCLAVALAITAGCSGGGSNAGAPVPFATSSVAPSTSASTVLSIIAGVGDSLTAGEQSSALIGQSGPNPFFGSTSTLPAIPSTQDRGFWPLLWAQAKGSTPSQAPMPYIKFPGLGAFLIPTKSGFSPLQPDCGGQNAVAFDSASALSVRLDPTRLPQDVAIPGQTVHEALYQIAPAGPCAAVSAGPGALFQVESTELYPILAQFPGLSQVQAAVSLRPTLTTVFLGGNDLLKYAFSGGQFGPTPPSSIQADLLLAVRALQNAGSQVVLATVPDILASATVVPLNNLGAALQLLGVPPAFAQPFAVATIAANNLTPGAYVTLSGVLKIAGAVKGGVPPALGTGEVFSASFAGQIQSLNDSYNATIASVAQQTNSALADLNASFRSFNSGIPINPPRCCTIQYGGGIFSYDGLHPSNTGYALIANVFINAINAKYQTSIPAVNVAAIYAGDPYAPH